MFEKLIHRVLLRQGYMWVADVEAMIARVGERMAKMDEHLAREYVIDPMPGGIQHKIELMCRRRRSVFEKVAAEELRTQRERVATG